MLNERARVRFGAFTMLLALALQVVIFPAVALAATIEIPVGTVVTVVFNDTVDPTTTAPGQTVMLSVVNPVLIGGTTVIEAGAPVLGEVTMAVKRGSIGKPAQIGVALRHVVAVDGTNIALSGSKQMEGEDKTKSALVITILCCVLGLLQKGGAATIPSGAQVQAMTMAPATITVAG
jgi:hypothetical protein